MFLTVEGIDGCGKSTQLELLRSRLQSLGHEVVATREPGGTALAETIRTYLLHGRAGLSSEAELLLFAAARAQHVDEIIRPALQRGAIVLSDRYTDSTRAYQGGGLGLNDAFIGHLNLFATGGLVPDATLLFDLDVKTAGERRAAQRGEDRIEARGLEFQEKVRNAFRAIAEAEPKRLILLDAMPPAKVIHERVVKRLTERKLWPQ